MKYFSMFTGVGGFELGIGYAKTCTQSKELRRETLCSREDSNSTQSGIGEQQYSCIGMSEIDKYANQVLRYRFPNIKNYGDCKEINWSDVPDFDLLVGGSPCQDLSVAGKQAGITGERSGLFAEFIRAIKEREPKHFIWENVKGALSSNKGWDFTEVQTQMAEAGYSLWWQVLNAKDFGVPQNRERIFIVGTRGECGREVLFEREENESNTGKVHRVPLRFLSCNQKNIQGDYAYTVDTSQTSGVSDGIRVRRLTPKECERLMSWPDDWTRWGINDKGEKVEMSDTQRYKMCGNGVVSEVVKAVIDECIPC